jgi:hypothetical protein
MSSDGSRRQNRRERLRKRGRWYTLPGGHTSQVIINSAIVQVAPSKGRRPKNLRLGVNQTQISAEPPCLTPKVRRSIGVPDSAKRFDRSVA